MSIEVQELEQLIDVKTVDLKQVPFVMVIQIAQNITELSTNQVPGESEESNGVMRTTDVETGCKTEEYDITNLDFNTVGT